MSAIAQTLSNPSIFQGELTQSGHKYTHYDPQSSLSRANRWGIFWKTAIVVSSIAYVALSTLAVALTAGSTLLTAATTGCALLGIVAFSKIVDSFNDKIQGHAKAARMASGILKKMEEITDSNLDKKLQMMGVAPKSGDNQQKRLLVARYEYHQERLEKVEGNIQKASQEINQLSPCDFSTKEGAQAFSQVQGLRLSIDIWMDLLADIKLEKAYTLRVLEDPSRTHTATDYYHRTNIGFYDQLIARGHEFIPHISKGDKAWSTTHLLAMSEEEIRSEIFSTKA